MQNYNNSPRNPSNPHNAVEVPIPKEKTSFGGILIFIFLLFGLILAAIAVVKNPYFAEKYGKSPYGAHLRKVAEGKIKY